MRRRRSRRRPLVAVLGAILLMVVLYVAGGGAGGSGGSAPDTSADGPSSAPAPTNSTATAPTPGPETPAPPASAEPPGSAGPSASVTPPAGDPALTTAASLLETLAVKGRAPKTGYDREEQFGSAWLDVDRNGCNTRDDILARDLVDIQRSGPCRVLAGTLSDPYTATTIAFVRGQTTSTLVQIDHLVPLLDAWQTGAQQSSIDERIAFANDPLNLEAADGPANSSKGAGDAATWLPPNTAFRCEYVARQIAVKAQYRLWVTQAEHDAMARVLSGCPDHPVPTSG